jgi:uncharacterized Zn-binding protein involved in type VI secretion
MKKDIYSATTTVNIEGKPFERMGHKTQEPNGNLQGKVLQRTQIPTENGGEDILLNRAR